MDTAHAKTTLTDESFVSEAAWLGFHLCYSSIHRSKRLPRKTSKVLVQRLGSCDTLQGFADRSKQRDLKSSF
ncbi:hypothetical protein, partial [Comamonas thiooxydans]|uniref:hypothetical protein n=1 Tax=Comamonas thiooxydans TaxID=363952 RepID=UPI001A94A555